MTLEEAKQKMSQESIDRLIEITTTQTEIDVSKKACNDILMQALCNAVTNQVINPNWLDEKTIKMLNSPTNTLAEEKMNAALENIRKYCPSMHVEIILHNSKLENVKEWDFPGPYTFNQIFEDVVTMFDITPHAIRTKMTNVLKPTIVNNIAQMVTKYQSLTNKNDMKVSINTITRLVNMEHHAITAEFKRYD